MPSSVLPTAYNGILVERLTAWVTDSVAAGAVEERIHEWDDVNYLLSRSPEGRITLSLSMPREASVGKAAEAVAAAYRGVATSISPPPGFAIAVELNVRMLAKVDPQHREFLMRELASLRLTVQGAPLREHFERLVAGTCAPGPVEAHCSRPGQLYFMQPRHGAVAVTFPVRFSSPFDACTGRAFLHEFAEARREPVLGRAPSCSYSQQPPAELQGVDPSTLADVNGGYVSFTFNERHVHGPQMPHVVWSMCSFYFLISCHLKACKAAMNAKMRSSMDAMCTELRSHRVPWEATQL